MNKKDNGDNIEKLKEMIENALKSDCSCIHDNQHSDYHIFYNREREIINDRDRYIGVDNFTAKGIKVI